MLTYLPALFLATFETFADITANIILFEAMFTMHHTHCVTAFLTLACVTSIVILLEAMFTGHVAAYRHFSAGVAFAHFASIFVFLETMLTITKVTSI